MVDDLKIIKKYYGEAMMHFCRNNFATILEQSGSLSNILLSHFVPSKFLYNDIIEQAKGKDFRSYIYNIFDGGIKEVEEVVKTPEELMQQVGYTLYECKTEEDIQKFRKYYAANEELCTFWTNRLNDCYVFFAVRDDVNEIKREDFFNPDRQDAYGTSVISIQFTRDDAHLLSIKNRYNHKVPHPDATFSNNLDNIVEGLTDSFAVHYGMKQRHENVFLMDGYVLASDGKYYKYNYEINNIYYCPDNIIISNGHPITYEREKYLVMDYFVLDLEKKKIDTFEDQIVDYFPKTIPCIKKVAIFKEDNSKRVIIIPDVGEEIVIVLDDKNRIVEYINHNVKFIGDGFLRYAKNVMKLDLAYVTVIGDYFCCYAVNMIEIDLPNVTMIGKNFLADNRLLRRLFLPNVEFIGNNFCFCNICLEEGVFPKLAIVGYNFLYNNVSLKRLFAPMLQHVGSWFCNNIASFEETDIVNVSDDVRNFLKQNFIIPDDQGGARKK